MSEKPRPRPRPRPRLATNSQNATTAGAGPSSVSSPTQTGSTIGPNNAQDESDLFFRNRGWDASVLKARAARAKKADDDLPSTHQEESDDDFGFDGSPNSKRRFKAAKMKPPPAWTTQVERGSSVFADRRSSAVISSDEERHLVLSDSDGSATGPTNRNGKRPKVRAKSRSPTPPPALPDHIRNEARRIARQVVREQDPINMIGVDGTGAQRAHQAPFNIESSEEDDPDFAAITAKVRAEYKRKVPTSSSTPTNGAGPSTSSNVVKVKILVKWVPHPFDEFAKEQPEERWEYFIDRDSNLREIFAKTARLKHLIASQLVVTHDGHQIYHTSTPRSLEGLSGEIHLSACDDNTHMHLQDMRKKGLTSTGEDPRLEFSGVGGLNASAPAEGSDNEGDKTTIDEPKKIKIGLRSTRFPQTKHLNVRVEMTCGAILQHYLKVMKIEGKHDKARLSIDGEHLDPDSHIGDADIDLDDDEALVDVVGL